MLYNPSEQEKMFRMQNTELSYMQRKNSGLMKKYVRNPKNKSTLSKLTEAQSKCNTRQTLKQSAKHHNFLRKDL